MWRAVLVWLWGTAGVPAPESLESALALEQGGQDGAALVALERLIVSRPGFALARLEAARLYLKAEHELSRAECHLEAARSLAPENPRVHYLWAMLMDGRGRREEALSALEVAVMLRPDYPDAQLRLGGTYFERADWPKAEKHFRALTQWQPDSVHARMRLAEVLGRQSRWDDAERELRAVLEVQPRSPAVVARLADLYERTGRKRQAAQVRAAADPSPKRKLRPLRKSAR